MRTILAGMLLLAALMTCSSDATKQSGAPYTLEQIYGAPFPQGIGPRAISISDDARFLACAWNDEGIPCRNLWIQDRSTGQWTQHTDFWAEHEARRRREFARSLEQQRKEWDEAQAKKKEEAAAAEAASTEEKTGEAGSAEQTVTVNDELDESMDQMLEKEEEVEEGGELLDEGEAHGEHDEESAVDEAEESFDAQEKIDEFEEELKKELRVFSGLGETLWRRGSHELLYVFDGAVWSIDLDQSAPRPVERLRHELGFSGISRIDGSEAMLLLSDADVMMWWPLEGRLRQLTFGGWSDYDNAGGYSVSHGGRWLAACSRDYTSMRKSTLWSVLEDDPSSRRQFYVRPQDGMETANLRLLDLSESRPWEIEVKLDEDPNFYVQRIAWSPVPGDERLLFSVIGGDTETHSTYLLTPLEEVEPGEDEYELEKIYSEHDEAWINWGFTRADWASDGTIILNSEKSGYSSLYRLERGAAAESVEAAETDESATAGWNLVPLYEQKHEVTEFWALPHSPWLIIQLALPDPTCRTLSALHVHTGQVISLVDAPDWSGDYLNYSDDESLLAYLHTKQRSPGNIMTIDLAAALRGEKPAEQLALDRTNRQWLDWTASWNVQFIRVPGKAGEIWAKLYLPPDWKPGQKYPLMVWAHGAGYAQTVKQDAGHWELFHPWLAQEKGWIAVEVDWRASSGYGRDWRVAVTNQLGTPEVEDILSVKDYLETHYGSDPERSAIWGWSYGGFLTLMALGQAPGEFQAGCAVAPAIDWRNYNYWYGTCRLDDPKENEEAYEKSDATTYIEHVTDRLLIIHGMQDDNTLFQTVAKYIEKGHEKGVNIDLKLYPAGGHGIGRDFHYRAMYETMLQYCEDSWK